MCATHFVCTYKQWQTHAVSWFLWPILYNYSYYCLTLPVYPCNTSASFIPGAIVCFFFFSLKSRLYISQTRIFSQHDDQQKSIYTKGVVEQTLYTQEFYKHKLCTFPAFFTEKFKVHWEVLRTFFPHSLIPSVWELVLLFIVAVSAVVCVAQVFFCCHFSILIVVRVANTLRQYMAHICY